MQKVVQVSEPVQAQTKATLPSSKQQDKFQSLLLQGQAQTAQPEKQQGQAPGDEATTSDQAVDQGQPEQAQEVAAEQNPQNEQQAEQIQTPTAGIDFVVGRTDLPQAAGEPQLAHQPAPAPTTETHSVAAVPSGMNEQTLPVQLDPLAQETAPVDLQEVTSQPVSANGATVPQAETKGAITSPKASQLTATVESSQPIEPVHTNEMPLTADKQVLPQAAGSTTTTEDTQAQVPEGQAATIRPGPQLQQASPRETTNTTAEQAVEPTAIQASATKVTPSLDEMATDSMPAPKPQLEVATQVKVQAVPTNTFTQTAAAVGTLDLSQIQPGTLSSQQSSKASSFETLITTANSAASETVTTQAAQKLESILSPVVKQGIAAGQPQNQQLVFKLQPANLGEMKIVVKTNQHSAQLQFEVQNDAVKDMLEGVTRKLDQILTQLQAEPKGTEQSMVQAAGKMTASQSLGTLGEQGTAQRELFQQGQEQRRYSQNRRPTARIVSEEPITKEEQDNHSTISLLV